MPLEENGKNLKVGNYTFYKMAKERKNSGVKIEFGRDDKIIIHLPYRYHLKKSFIDKKST